MMPKLAHKKSRTGCLRCKARKVKCDEGQPRCGACTRHGVHCEYERKPDPKRTSTTPVPSQDAAGGSAPNPDGSSSFLAPPHPYPNNISPALEHLSSRSYTSDPHGQAVESHRNLLELQLLHFYVTHVYDDKNSTDTYWRIHCPTLGFKHPFLLNAIMALAAFRRSSREGEADLRKLAQAYWNRALEGHREALLDITEENGEAIFAASCLVSAHALVELRDAKWQKKVFNLEPDGTDFSEDPILWLRLAKGSRAIWERCHDWLEKSPTMIDLLNDTETARDDDGLVGEENRRPFGQILEWATDYEYISPEDQEAYLWAVCALGDIYNRISARSETVDKTSRRIFGLPITCPPRFIELIEESRPRALVLLAHIFALVKLLDVDGEHPRFRGIAESQVPKLYERLPPAWREMMAWPMSISDEPVSTEHPENYVP